VLGCGVWCVGYGVLGCGVWCVGYGVLGCGVWCVVCGEGILYTRNVVRNTVTDEHTIVYIITMKEHKMAKYSITKYEVA
jgi:hypothetical protein